MTQEDDILWKADHGVFGSADDATRWQLQKDEPAFVLASIKFDPLLSVDAALRNWSLQLLLVFVEDPLIDPARTLAHPWTDAIALKHLQPTLKPCEVSVGCQRVPIPRLKSLLFAVHAPIILLSLVVLGYCGVAATRWLADLPREDERRPHLLIIFDAGVLIFASVVLNAACFGILSGPFPRYQARIIWLIPMIAVLGALAVYRDASRASQSAQVKGLVLSDSLECGVRREHAHETQRPPEDRA